MSQYRIGILNGDDIGLEIVPVAVEVIKSAVKKYPDIEIEWVVPPQPKKWVKRLQKQTAAVTENV